MKYNLYAHSASTNLKLTQPMIQPGSSVAHHAKAPLPTHVASMSASYSIKYQRRPLFVFAMVACSMRLDVADDKSFNMPPP